jgi:hypothetical protein
VCGLFMVTWSVAMVSMRKKLSSMGLGWLAPTNTWVCRTGWWPTSIGDRNSLRGKYYPNLLIRHKGSQRIYVSLNKWVVNSAAPGNSLARTGLSVATVL